MHTAVVYSQEHVTECMNYIQVQTVTHYAGTERYSNCCYIYSLTANIADFSFLLVVVNYWSCETSKRL